MIAAREQLLRLREKLLAVEGERAQSSQVVELDQSRVGRLSRMDALQAQAMSQASGRRRDTMLKSITAALQRIDNKAYGYCRSCEEPINPKRLEVDPMATFCIQCAEMKEQ